MNKAKSYTEPGLEQVSSAQRTDVLLTEPPRQAGHVLFTIIKFQQHDNNYEITINLTRGQRKES